MVGRKNIRPGQGSGSYPRLNDAPGQIGSHVMKDRNIDPKQPPVIVEGDVCFSVWVSFLAGRGTLLVAVFRPGHWMIELHGQPTYDYLFVIHDALGAESAS